MAHKKAQSSSYNSPDSAGRRLGWKKYPGEVVIEGNIILRQRGTKFFSSINTGLGKDHTIFALCPGTVRVFNKCCFGKYRTYVAVDKI